MIQSKTLRNSLSVDRERQRRRRIILNEHNSVSTLRAMELPQFEKLKQSIADFKALQKKYAEFGADGKGTQAQFQQGIKDMVTRQVNIFPVTPVDWKLFKSMPDCPKVADALNQVAHDTVEQIRIIDWKSPLAEVIKTFVNEYCGQPLFTTATQKPKIHSMQSYAGVKWIQSSNDEYDPAKSWEENYRILEARYVEETSHLIKKVRELAANLPESATLSTKTIKLVQMPDGTYAKDWKSSPGSIEIVTVANPFVALHFPDKDFETIFKTYFAPKGGKVVTMTMSLALAEKPGARKKGPKTGTDRFVENIVKKFKTSSVIKAFARATKEHVRD
ncbi:MAG: hypothetical protein JWM68_1191 [Verrucomicrobiales bacterium]|nr:hypothetical protein [Verrucomicrobiales bacterium]